MRIDFAIVNGRPCRVTGWTTEADLLGADCSYGHGETLAEAGGFHVSQKDVYSVHLGWLAAAVLGGIAGAAVLAVAASANMPQNFCSPRNPGCVPAGWVADDRGSGRDVAGRCTGGPCRGEMPETVPQPDRTKGLA